MVHVRRLRDNGQWDLFEDTANTLSRKYTAFEAQIILSLERGIAACYNNRLREAKEKIKSAIHLASGLENSSVLIGKTDPANRAGLRFVRPQSRTQFSVSQSGLQSWTK